MLFGIGDESLRRTIRARTTPPSQDALGYLERQAAVARRGPAGCISVRGHGLVAAAFLHRTSRAGDPQLHTHVVVANLVQADDGRWSALDGRRLYAHAKTAGYLYEARLRAELTRELGVEWTPVRNGIADIAGVPRSVLQAFSRRRAQIDAGARRAAARVEPRAAQVGDAGDAAPQGPRRRRRRRWTRSGASARPSSDSRASTRATCFGRARTGARRRRPARRASRARRPGRADASALVVHAPRRDAGAGASGCRRARRSTSRCSSGWPTTSSLLTDAVVLAVGEPARVRDDGAAAARRPHRCGRCRTSGATRPLALLRRRSGWCVERFRTAEPASGSRRRQAVERAIAARPTLSGEQEEMVRRLARDGDGVAVVVGAAGAGKTFALAAAREAWEAERHAGGRRGDRVARRARPRGGGRDSVDERRRAARSARARIGCRGGACSSSMRRRWSARGSWSSWSRPSAASDGKLVLVGDDRQVPEIEAGGAFRGLRDAAAGDRAAREPPPGRGVGARRARAAARRPRPARRSTQLRGARSLASRRRRARRRAARRGLVDRRRAPSGA